MSRPCCQWSAEKQVRYLELYQHRTHCYVRLLYIEPGFGSVIIGLVYFEHFLPSWNHVRTIDDKCVFENVYHLSLSNLDFYLSSPFQTQS